MKILFVASEVFPLIKTGGLGDVSYSLPQALASLGEDVRLLLPAYRGVLRQLDSIRILGWLDVRGASGMVSVRVLESRHPDFDFPLWFVDCPSLFDRPGNPYLAATNQDWPDNAERYTVFSRIAAQVASGEPGLGWQADVVHANDWQTGLVPAFLSELPMHPRTVFTIHNLAYGGYFTHGDFVRLQLPGQWWSSEGVEFYGGLSMLKAGIVYADVVTTVSPTYANEIRTPAFGYGLDGLLDSRAHKLHGILNGIDTKVWDPARDVHLAAHYSLARLNPGKKQNKHALLEKFLPNVDEAAMQPPLLGMVGRMVEQKGMDWVLAAIPKLLEESDARFVLLGSGDAAMEKKFMALVRQHPQRIFVQIGYDESLAHLIEAGSDMFLMPSRFEPCGLNQMYSLRYGTPPVVYRTGGLADTVVDASPENLSNGSASGFVFDVPGVAGLVDAVQRGLNLMKQPAAWRKIVRTGMAQDFSWDDSAKRYLSLYQNK